MNIVFQKWTHLLPAFLCIILFDPGSGWGCAQVSFALPVRKGKVDWRCLQWSSNSGHYLFTVSVFWWYLWCTSLWAGCIFTIYELFLCSTCTIVHSSWAVLWMQPTKCQRSMRLRHCAIGLIVHLMDKWLMGDKYNIMLSAKDLIHGCINWWKIS